MWMRIVTSDSRFSLNLSTFKQIHTGMIQKVTLTLLIKQNHLHLGKIIVNKYKITNNVTSQSKF